MDALLPRVRSRTLYIVSALGLAVFTLLLGIVQTLPALALLLVFRGFSWPAMHLASYTLVAEISHPSNVATNQAILQVTMPSVAVLLTGSLFGWTFGSSGCGNLLRALRAGLRHRRHNRDRRLPPIRHEPGSKLLDDS